MPVVDFYYDYISPYSYLAYTQRRTLEEAGGELRHHPIFLGGLMASLRVDPPFMRPGVRRVPYLVGDVQRWARRYGVPMSFPAAFPMNTLPLLRAATLAAERGRIDPFSERAFQAVWVEGLAVADDEAVGRIAAEAGLDPAETLAHIARNDVKMQVKAATNEALEQGVFGAPTFFLGEEQYFGNDRLDFVLEDLRAVRS